MFYWNMLVVPDDPEKIGTTSTCLTEVIFLILDNSLTLRSNVNVCSKTHKHKYDSARTMYNIIIITMYTIIIITMYNIIIITKRTAFVTCTSKIQHNESTVFSSSLESQSLNNKKVICCGLQFCQQVHVTQTFCKHLSTISGDGIQFLMGLMMTHCSNASVIIFHAQAYSKSDSDMPTFRFRHGDILIQVF